MSHQYQASVCPATPTLKRRCRRAETVIRVQLVDEREPVVMPEEYAVVQGDLSFRTRRIADCDGSVTKRTCFLQMVSETTSLSN
jgi:hypothetical protein